MYRLRAYWVDAYLKDIFWAGMTTGQSAESINSFFDGFVNANAKLVEFQNYDGHRQLYHIGGQTQLVLCLHSQNHQRRN